MQEKMCSLHCKPLMASINSLGETKVAREFELGMGHHQPNSTSAVNPRLSSAEESCSDTHETGGEHFFERAVMEMKTIEGKPFDILI
jgi:hypothetical protein